jgi:hypothetical protein
MFWKTLATGLLVVGLVLAAGGFIVAKTQAGSRSAKAESRIINAPCCSVKGLPSVAQAAEAVESSESKVKATEISINSGVDRKARPWTVQSKAFHGCPQWRQAGPAGVWSDAPSTYADRKPNGRTTIASAVPIQ